MPNKAVFIDRDGTITVDTGYCSRPEDLKLFPDSAAAIKMLNDNNYKVIIVTNQSGIAKKYFTHEILWTMHQKMIRELLLVDARIDGIYYCPHNPSDYCNCRKPKPEMIYTACKEYNIDLGKSWVVGDLADDIALGKAVGCRTILVRSNTDNKEQIIAIPNYATNSLLEAVEIICGGNNR